MAEVSFERLSVRYGKRRALDELSGSVGAGEWLGLIGPNGAGKSSFIKAVAGVVKSSGVIKVDGEPLHSMSARQRAQVVAYVPQKPLIPTDMTAADYVLLGRTPFLGYFGIPQAKDRDIVHEVLERLRLGPFAERFLGELSGGEQQRVVLARALAQQAPVLLLDEPTSALDIGHQQQALELVAELRTTHELTIIAAMHDLTLAATYTDRLTMLAEGQVVAAGKAREVLTAQRLGEVYNVCVSVDYSEEDDTVIVVPRRGFPVP